jgi:hypothetical protein
LEQEPLVDWYLLLVLMLITLENGTQGSDYGSYPYGGWQNFAVNPEVAPSITTACTWYLGTDGAISSKVLELM